MKIIRDSAEVFQYRQSLSGQVALVPTMGALHEGHLALVRAAQQSADHVVVSIYVNPLQFRQGEDFNTYPRDFERDQELLEELEVSCLFAPRELESRGVSTKVFNSQLSDLWCGASRPGHFNGVLAVISKLQNLIQPTEMWFGQKDYQQALIIKTWAEEFYVPVCIKIHSIVRDSDGLALSSRNQYLTSHEKSKALNISKALFRASSLKQSGEEDPEALKKEIKGHLDGLKLDYLEIVDPETLSPCSRIGSGSVILIAVFCGSTRLIDNIIL